ncbi:MAG: hypothetical protein U9R26_10245 [Campylobacterota bacterium]|nr:hypothetical protein [Campylobacterota bacterium]
MDNFKVLEFDKSSSLVFAKEKAKLKKQGNIIADMDLMIASIAMQNDCSLLTNNLKYFERIESLKEPPKIEKIVQTSVGVTAITITP